MISEPTQAVASATWYEEFYAGLDGKDISVVDRFCTEDTSIVFGNRPAVVGREAVRASMLHVWSTMQSMSHEFTNVVEAGDTAVLEALVTYTLLDGSVVKIPACTVIERRDGLVAAKRIYLDPAPLHA